MSSPHTSFFDVLIPISELDMDMPDALIDLNLEIEVEFELSVHDFGRPAVMYLANGDPGYPEEGPEYEIELVSNMTLMLARYIPEPFQYLTEKMLPSIAEWVEGQYETLADGAYESLTKGD